METPNGYAQFRQLFGNPANEDGSLNHAWQDANIIKVPPPAEWKLFNQDDANPLIAISGIRMHRLFAGSFITVMQEIWEYAKQQVSATASDHEVRAWLHQNRLDQTGGGFNFRMGTGNPNNLSLHSYGIAIDWDPLDNPHKKPLTKNTS